MTNLNILLLCNNPIATPAIKELLFRNKVKAVLAPKFNKEINEILPPLLDAAGVPLIFAERQNVAERIAQAISNLDIHSVWMMTFPYIIPADIVKLPSKGFINFHYGKLPEYRGPEPIFAQLVNQEKAPGVAVHLVDEGIDTGPVILQESLTGSPYDTYGQLRSRLGALAAKLSVTLLKILEYGTMIPASGQDNSKACYYNRPVKKDLMIDWQTMDSHTIQALVNACNPWNKGAGSKINDTIVGITEIDILPFEENDQEPGTIVKLDANEGLLVKTVDERLIRINIGYTTEGFLPGHKWGYKTGVNVGMKFE